MPFFEKFSCDCIEMQLILGADLIFGFIIGWFLVSWTGSEMLPLCLLQYICWKSLEALLLVLF